MHSHCPDSFLHQLNSDDVNFWVPSAHIIVIFIKFKPTFYLLLIGNFNVDKESRLWKMQN